MQVGLTSLAVWAWLCVGGYARVEESILRGADGGGLWARRGIGQADSESWRHKRTMGHMVGIGPTSSSMCWPRVHEIQAIRIVYEIKSDVILLMCGGSGTASGFDFHNLKYNV